MWSGLWLWQREIARLQGKNDGRLQNILKFGGKNVFYLEEIP